MFKSRGGSRGGPGWAWPTLATISIEKDIVSSLDLDTIVDKFAATDKNRRLTLT